MKTRVVSRLLLYLLICFYALSGVSCLSITGWDKKENRQPEGYSPFIWKTVINRSAFYLAGSVHTGKKIFYPLPEQYMECYEKADAIVMEIADTFDSLEEKMFDYAEKDRISEDLYLRNKLNPGTIKKILKIVNKRYFTKYDQYSGWLLNMIIEGQKLNLAGFDSEYGVDIFFRRKAADDNKPVKGLEKFEDQLRLYEMDLLPETQVSLIEQTLSSIESKVREEARIIDAYFNGNINLFKKLFVSKYDFGNEDVKKVYDRIFTERNRKWIEELEKMASGEIKTYTVIVGAGHFFGPDNIRVLLERKGYRVTALK